MERVRKSRRDELGAVVAGLGGAARCSEEGRLRSQVGQSLSLFFFFFFFFFFQD